MVLEFRVVEIYEFAKLDNNVFHLHSAFGWVKMLVDYVSEVL